jgi:ribosome-binding protein aMBF1 (putative translation factor)
LVIHAKQRKKCQLNYSKCAIYITFAYLNLHLLPNLIKISDLKKELGLLVKTLRKNKKMSQQDLADAMDVSRITIQNLESGRNFTIDTFLLAMEHFQMLHTLNNWFQERRMEQEDLKSLY